MYPAHPLEDEEWVVASFAHPPSTAAHAAFLSSLHSAHKAEETKEEKAHPSASSRARKTRNFLHRLIIPSTQQTVPASSSTLQPLSPLSARSSSSSSLSSSQSSPSPLRAALVPPPSPTPSPSPASSAGAGAWPYASAELLTFQQDDIIRVLKRDVEQGSDSGGGCEWCYGEVVGLPASKPGRFPASFTHAATASAPSSLSFPSSSSSVTSSTTSTSSTSTQSGAPSSSASSSVLSSSPLPASSSSILLGESEFDGRGQQQKKLVDMIRERVSKKKRRYQRDGYDLDLSYITPSIIAMGFPSESLEGLYRNRMSDVQDFLASRHGDRTKVYNLCSERSYPADRFPHTARYPFDDHNPSPLGMIEAFCADAHAWLSQSPQAVAVLHCKAGKGRTGFMIACYLLYCGMFTEADEALRFYAIRRTKNAKGVTIPSQIRYCHYFQRLLSARKIPLPPSLSAASASPITATTPLPSPPPPSDAFVLLAIRLHGVPRVTQSKDISFTLKQADATYTSSRAHISVVRSSPPQPPTLTLIPSSTSRGITALHGDVQLVLYADARFDQVKLLQCWFNTRFLGPEMEAVQCRRATEHVRRLDADDPAAFVGGEEGDAPARRLCEDVHGERWALVLTKGQLDKACKDTKHKNFPEDFRLELIVALTS